MLYTEYTEFCAQVTLTLPGNKIVPLVRDKLRASPHLEIISVGQLDQTLSDNRRMHLFALVSLPLLYNCPIGGLANLNTTEEIYNKW